MEQFVVSARKYRPATFDTVVGQKSITDTLKSAILNQHLAQAFLFTGSRGVGKTTVARILAKTINCMNRTEDTEPCDNCDSCNSFNEGHSLNIYELDAASNNSVDDIRSLIEQVRMAPQIGSHKVYIIDEVHMLSQAAFNAFLKTLEEPPAHAIFILATTEKHKIIPTILSRCQIFDFVRIRIGDMVDHLASIAKKEGIDFEEEAIHIIAEKADGALRDALSIFDQQVSFASKNLSYQNVINNLNILDYDYYFKITEALKESDIPNSLLLFNQILSNGFEGHQFLVGLAGHLRNLLVCKSPETITLLEVSEKVQKRYLDQAKSLEHFFLFQAIEILSKADFQYKSSLNKRLLIELSLMQVASLHSDALEKKKPIISD
jgi:DNA polymerase-3 subunit gamma/tau